LARSQTKRAVQCFVIQFEQYSIAAILLHALSEALALQRIQIRKLGSDHWLSGYIDQAKAGGAADTIVRQHRRALGHAILLQAATQIDAARGRHFCLRLGDSNASYTHAVNIYGLHLHGQRW
ncbi:hypothetical protein LPV64_00020, partial [Ralstonia pseudosolanacearum]|nr:hypothetical protein [Ralstonia pseudosolanacearum]